MIRLSSAVAVAAFVLAACSSGGSDQHTSPQITLSSINATQTKATVIPADESLISLDVQWQSWDGEQQSSIQVTDDSVTIMGDPNAADVVVGAHDFRTPLTAGLTYVLDVDDLSTEGAAALIFPYGPGGDLVSVSDNGFGIATPGNPFTFVAPELVLGFWIQVQNKWGDPASDATLRPVFGVVDTPPVVDDAELIDLSVPFERWNSREPWYDIDDPDNCIQPVQTNDQCRAPGVSVDDDEILIAAGGTTTTDQGVTYYEGYSGVQYYPGVPLDGRYQLSITSDQPYTTVQLFGLNIVGTPDLRYTTTSTAVTGQGVPTHTVSFDAVDVPGFAISVGSPWVSTRTTPTPAARISISLQRTGD